LIKVSIYSWLLFWVILGIIMFADTQNQINQDKEFIENEIKPSVEFIKKFRTENDRLPLNREYYTWRREYHKDYSSDLKQSNDLLIAPGGPYIRKSSDVVIGELGIEDQSVLDNIDWKNDFVIGIWRGEWNEYYFSSNDKYFGNGYSWNDGLVSLLISFTIGILPFLFWWKFGN